MPQAAAWTSNASRLPTNTGWQSASTSASRAALSEISGPMPAGSPIASATRGFILRARRAASLELDARGADHPAPALDFLAHERRRFGRAVAKRLGREVGE